MESTHYQLHHTRGTTVIASARDTADTRYHAGLLYEFSIYSTSSGNLASSSVYSLAYDKIHYG